MIAPPYTGNSDLDSFLYNLYLNGTENSSASGLTPNTSTGEITDSEGNIFGYLYQFIHVKYADSNTGLNISNTQTGKSYYGIHNSSVSTESTNPADYTWYQVVGTFGTTKSLYYYVFGGRQIKFDVNTAPQDYHWLLDSGVAINLDLIVPAQTITANELIDAAVTEVKLANAAVTASKTNIAAISNTTGNLVANSVGTTQITDDAVTSQKIIANAITAGKIAANAVTAVNIEANAITADKILAGAVTSDKLTVNNLSAITANTGTLNVTGNFKANTAEISGTSMTGSGGIIYPDGKFAFGNSTSNIVHNGSVVRLNGFSTGSSNSLVNINPVFGSLGTPPNILLNFTPGIGKPFLISSSLSMDLGSGASTAVSVICRFYFGLYDKNNVRVNSLSSGHVQTGGVLVNGSLGTKRAYINVSDHILYTPPNGTYTNGDNFYLAVTIQNFFIDSSANVVSPPGVGATLSGNSIFYQALI